MEIYHLSHLYTFQNHVESFASFGVDSGWMIDDDVLAG